MMKVNKLITGSICPRCGERYPAGITNCLRRRCVEPVGLSGVGREPTRLWSVERRDDQESRIAPPNFYGKS
jgi:hypothetical protein